MEETDSSSSTSLSNHNKTSFGTRLKINCLSFAVSIQETFRYVKAFFVGQVINSISKNNPFPFLATTYFNISVILNFPCLV